MFELTEQQQKSKDMWIKLFTDFRDYEHDESKAEKEHNPYANVREHYVANSTMTVAGHRQSLKIAAAEEMASKDKSILFLGSSTNPANQTENNFLDYRNIDFDLLIENRDKGNFVQSDLIFIEGVNEEMVHWCFTFFVDGRRTNPDFFHPKMKIIVLLNKLAIN